MSKPFYEDDWVTLYHGDCLELADVWTGADVLVTDPPYGIKWQGYRNYTAGPGSKVDWSNVPIQNDTSTGLRDAALDLWGMKPAMVFGTWKQPKPDGVGKVLVWNKEGAYSGPLNAAFFTTHEEIYVLGSGFRKSAPPQRSVITTTEHRSVAANQAGHPTPKPIGLMETLIDRCPPGVVADPFAGSGSTLLAARNLGRKAIGVELEEKYCEVIVKRLAQQAFDFSALEGL